MKIVLDPGHGGKDPGAVGFGICEKDVVLKLAKLVKNELLNNYENVQVLMTREGDVFVELNNRAKFANQNNADFFVSLHCNASGSGVGEGFETFVYLNPSQKTIEYQNVVHNEVMNYLKKFNVKDRGKKRANLAVCRETKMPAVLIENLFIDCKRENDLLRNDEFLAGLAKAIATGIAKALNLKAKNQQNAVKNVDVVYSVQVGAFSDKANAEKLIQQLKKFGLNGFIVEKKK